MQKLKLDELKIDSFQTSNKVEKKGTVAGNFTGFICETLVDCPTYDGTLTCTAEITIKC